ncbi:lactonase family protein [Flavobacterium tegetincola]|uniref:lactonase family protein n=1 Tax=Flavobacterium tegetincola TaxID=150172 RepID=UPI0003F753EE|nr:lactonase family protein [Flavobacterium tegetincola]
MWKNSLYILVLICFGIANAQETNLKFLVGTYTNTCKSDGIYVFDLDLNTGNTSLYEQSSNVVNPSYMSVTADGKIIYAVNENGAESTVSSFKYDKASSSIKLLNKQEAAGSDPCHIINDDKNVVVANYSSGSISVFKKSKTGSLNAASQVILHKGKSKNPDRQSASHVHQVQFSPDNKYVLATDLGTDKIYIYNYNPTSEQEVLTIKDSVSLKRGAGPRHLTFSPNGKFVYLLQELDGGMIVFNYQDGILRKLEETQIVDDDFKGIIGGAALHFSPDGKYLYATNRGSVNDITIFTVQADGRLNYKASVPSGGKGPRDFAIDPTGAFLLVANQNSNEIQVFRRDIISGMLSPLPRKIQICSPVHIVFIP